VRLLIGDIHACRDELEDLLAKAGVTAEDEIIALGDIVDRGPDVRGVLDLLRPLPRARSLLGNHERKHVRSSRGEVTPALSQVITRAELGEHYPAALAWMASLPSFLELEEAVVVHGFLEPGVALAEQRPTVLCGTLTGEHYLSEHFARPWYELYEGSKPLVVGHRDYLNTGDPLIHRALVFGIDTSCVHGGRLTGLLLPSFRIIQVPSRRDYWRETRERWRATHPSTDPARRRPSEETLAWVLEHIQSEHARVLARVRAGIPGFDALPLTEQGRAYAATIGESPIAGLLHLARKGSLSPDTLRRFLRTAADVERFVRIAGIPGNAEDNEEEEGAPESPPDAEA